MDEARARELRLEEQFTDGKVNSGFSYFYFKMDDPPDTIGLEIQMKTETLRLFFHKQYFAQFAREAMAVAREIA